MKINSLSVFLSGILLITACGGGGGGSGSDDDDNSGGGGTTTPADPAERYVLSGNNDGTLSIFRNNEMTGYSTAVGYFDAGGGFSIRDMIYDENNGRVVLVTNGQIIVISFDTSTGEIEELDTRSTSGNSSHLTLNEAGSVAYVASGTSTNQFVDKFEIASDGSLSTNSVTALGVDPDYIKLDPSGENLYIVSRTDDAIIIYGIDSGGDLDNTPITRSTDSDPSAIGFSDDGMTAYLTRQNNSDNLIVYRVDASDGDLTETSRYTNSNSPIDMVFSADGEYLYVLDSSNKNINHYMIDSNNGEPTFVESVNVSFTSTDIVLGHTGERLYVGHSEDDLVSTIDIDENDGTLEIAGWVRAFESVQTIAAIGDLGELQPASTFMLAPDDNGMTVFSVASDGMLTLDTTLTNSGSLIDGQVAVDYQKNLLLGAGDNAADDDLLTSAEYDSESGSLTAIDTINATVSVTASFLRVEKGGAGRVMYVLDEDVCCGGGDQGSIRTYAYASNGTITATSVDDDQVREGPENMSLHPAGNHIYSINSFDDNISHFSVSRTDGQLSGGTTYTPGGNGAGVGRPIEMRFHPNGRYAYVSLEDDDEIDRYEVATNGALENINRFSLPQYNGNDVEPAPLAVHPNGQYLYVGERGGSSGTGTLSVLSISQSNYSVSFQSRIETSENNAGWISIDPQGQYLYVRFNSGNIQRFAIDQGNGNLLSSSQTVATAGTAQYPTMTLVTPMQ